MFNVDDEYKETEMHEKKITEKTSLAEKDSPKSRMTILRNNFESRRQNEGINSFGSDNNTTSQSIANDRNLLQPQNTMPDVQKKLKPTWHAHWKCYRVISGHLGSVRSISFDPENAWFCTGSSDRTIRIWDTASGGLKLTLTGHIEQVTAIDVSHRHPYMFSCGLDAMVKLWDLEYNKVIRSYHGHLSGVYCLTLHPILDLLFTGGRDSVCRVWDIRTKVQIHCLSGHDKTVGAVLTRPMEPQVITGSYDSTIRLWDLRTGQTQNTLTFHKKSVRALASHPTENSFFSASADNIKKYRLPNGDFLNNMMQQQRCILNALAVNEDGVLVSGGDNGSIWFWDLDSSTCFGQQQTIVQPGSLDVEAGIFALSFDKTGSRLVTCEADKTIKMWKQDEQATPLAQPVVFKHCNAKKAELRF